MSIPDDYRSNMHVHTPEPECPRNAPATRRTVLALIACLVVATGAVMAWAIVAGRESSGASPQATEACRMFGEVRPSETPLVESHRRYQEIYEASRGAPEVRVTEAARELAELSSPVTLPMNEAMEVGEAAARLITACRVAGAPPVGQGP